MIETTIIAGLIGFMISNVVLVISRNGWRTTAKKLQHSKNYYEVEVRRQRESQGKAWEEVKEMKHGREHLQKRLNECSFEEDRLRAKIAELTETVNKSADGHFEEIAKRGKSDAELVSLRAKYESVERAMVQAKDQRDKAISDVLALSERLETLQAKIAELEASEELLSEARERIEQLKAERADLQAQLVASEADRERLMQWQSKATGRLNAIKTELATLPEPAE